MKPDRKKGPAKAQREVKPPARSHSVDPEPSSGHVALPVWLFVVVAVFLYWGMYYLDHHAGGFNAQVYQRFTSTNELAAWQPFDPAMEQFNKGMGVYNRPTCAACHGAAGAGAPGQYPPLAGSEWVNEPDPARVIRIILDGASNPMKVNGATFNGSMPPWRPILTDEEISQVATFVRKSWGNNAPDVKKEDVAKIRKETASHSSPWNEEDLKKVPVKQ